MRFEIGQQIWIGEFSPLEIAQEEADEAERHDYGRWLLRFFANRKGRIAEHFRAAARAIQNPWRTI